MSTATVVIPVEQAEFNTAVAQGRVPRNHYDVHAFSRLSTFHMPRSITVMVTNRDECVLRLDYPNEEPSDRYSRTSPLAPDWEFEVGKQTRKLLGMRVRNARVHFTRGAPTFPPEVAREWVREIPPHGHFACLRNAEVISQILSRFPESARTEIVQTLDRLCNSGQHQATAHR